MIERLQAIQQFYDAMKLYVPEEARILYSMFRGDPHSDDPGKWRARVMREPENLDPWANIYVCVSAMKRNAAGEFRRRKENFAGGLLLMIDDLGTGIGAKQGLELIKDLPPTALIETSPDNFQAVYLFDHLESSEKRFDALIRAFVHNCLLSPQNSGMDGINRVFRPPFGINGKSKYLREGKPWNVRLADWRPECRYSSADIAKHYKLELILENRIKPAASYMANVKPERRQMFLDAFRVLKSAGMLKRDEPNMGGWIDIVCPWQDTHSDMADNGASIRIPDEENEYYGAFRCHHGHCEGKGWRHLTQWLADESAEILTMVNDNALSFEYYNHGQ